MKDLFDKSLDIKSETISEPLERDLTIKTKENIDEDNFVFDIFKDDFTKFIDYIEQGENFSKFETELESNNDILEMKLDLPKQIQKNLWSSLVPTFVEYYNEGIQQGYNKIII